MDSTVVEEKGGSHETARQISVCNPYLSVAGLSDGVADWSLISPAQNVSAQDQLRGLLATPENLGYLGLTFTPVAVTDNLALSAITRDQAIEVALSNEPGLKAATDTASQLGLLRTVNDSGVTASDLAEGQLVWIVTFFGVNTASSGPPGAPRHISHEYHIVINALTGKYLMAFPLYEVTPKPPATQ